MRPSRSPSICGLLLITSSFCGACATTHAGSDVTAADFFVSTSGDDANPGSIEAPFATLARARDAVRAKRKADPDRGLRVLIRGGTYRLDQTVVFGLEDSAGANGPVVYEAYPGEQPTITSGVSLSGWNPASPELDGVCERARDKLWSAAVPPGIQTVSVLFDGERRLPRTRSRGFLPPPAADPAAGSLHELRLPPNTALPAQGVDALELVIVPTYPWVMNILPISGIDIATGVIRTEVPATYALGEVRFGHFADGNAWIENALADLDEPGEWVFDARTRQIHLWPVGPEPSAALCVPQLTQLLRIEGRIDYGGPADEPVRGLVFRGLHFTQADRFTWEKDKSGWGLQHDWEMFDRPTAMVRLRGAENCVFEACRFTNSGGTGIRLDLHARDNVVRGNLFSHLGGVGVLLAGYGPGTKDVNRKNIVEGNHIHHIGELLWHSPGVFAWQSGDNVIRGNLIHHCPYTAIVVSGRIVWDRSGKRECSATIRWPEVDPVLAANKGPLTWAQREPFLHGRRNIVEDNEIHDAMEVLRDGNCIYVSGTGGGNVVRGNYLHDVPSPNMNAAIRCDDDQHETTITGNLVWKTCGEGFIFKGKNTITQNIVADLRACGDENGHPSRGFLVLPYGDVTGAVVEHNIFYCTDPAMKVMTEGGVRNGAAALLRNCRADRNLYFCAKDHEWAAAHVREQCRNGVECESRVADPRFADPDRGDFRLADDSPAVRLGIRSLSLKRVDRAVFPFTE